MTWRTFYFANEWSISCTWLFNHVMPFYLMNSPSCSFLILLLAWCHRSFADQFYIYNLVQSHSLCRGKSRCDNRKDLEFPPEIYFLEVSGVRKRTFFCVTYLCPFSKEGMCCKYFAINKYHLEQWIAHFWCSFQHWLFTPKVESSWTVDVKLSWMALSIWQTQS